MAQQGQCNLVIRACLPLPHTKVTSYEEVSPWNGKEMKGMIRYLNGVVTQSLRGGSLNQCHMFNRARECSPVLLEFYMYARYTSHNDAPLC